jgi:hypothetical protein
MAIYVIDVPQTHYKWTATQEPPSLLWLALALAIALVGLIAGQAAIAIGLVAVAGACLLAIGPAGVAVGIVVGLLIQEVSLCVPHRLSF